MYFYEGKIHKGRLNDKSKFNDVFTISVQNSDRLSLCTRYSVKKSSTELSGKTTAISRTSPAAAENLSKRSFVHSIRLLYAKALSCFHKKESRHERTGKRDDQFTGPLPPIGDLGNAISRYFRPFRR